MQHKNTRYTYVKTPGIRHWMKPNIDHIAGPKRTSDITDVSLLTFQPHLCVSVSMLYSCVLYPTDVWHTQCWCQFVIPDKDKSSVITNCDTEIYIATPTVRYHVHRVYPRMWRSGRSPGARRLCSWHFRDASLHLQPILELSPLTKRSIFSRERASRAGDVRGAKRSVYRERRVYHTKVHIIRQK